MYITQPLVENDICLPMLIKANFKLFEHHAKLVLQGAAPSRTVITVIHEPYRGAAWADDFHGNARLPEFEVISQESVTILVRNAGHIMACGIYEVSLRQAEQIGVLLIPCVEQGIILSQIRENDVEIDAIFKNVSATQPVKVVQ